MDTPTRWDADTLAGALDALAEVPAWRMSAQRWDRVGLILDRMAAAFAGGDGQELREAVAGLRLSGPRRVSRVGSDSGTGVPGRVIERRSALIRTLSREQRDAG